MPSFDFHGSDGVPSPHRSDLCIVMIVVMTVIMDVVVIVIVVVIVVMVTGCHRCHGDFAG